MPLRRESGVTSVLCSKTLAQAGFTSAEQVKSRRVPTKFSFLWENAEDEARTRYPHPGKARFSGNPGTS